MAEQRAETLVEDGFTEVYVLDEGLQLWVEEGYPIEGPSNEVTGTEYHEDFPELQE